MKKVSLYTGIGILVFVFGFLAGFFWATKKLLHFPLIGPGVGEYPVEKLSPETSFWEMIYFGGNMVKTEKMAPPPKGTGYFTGKFIFLGKPVPGITFIMYFNSKYKSAPLTTDANGIFTLRLPTGEWFVNMIQCQEWKDKPEGDFMLLSGEEPKLSGGSFMSLFYPYSDQGKEVHVSNVIPSNPFIVITVRPQLRITWPNGMGTKEKATIAKSAITWEAYPQAKDYVVKIDRVTRESARSMVFDSLVYKKVTGVPSLSLSSLPHASDPIAKEEYAVDIQAYGPGGEFLSKSRHMKGTFTLTDGNVLVQDWEEEHGEKQESVDEKHQDTKVMNAAVTLIKERMFTEAEKLLTKIGGEATRGRKELLLGYLAASKGECQKASQLFDLAKSKGQECIPEEYRVGCK